MDRAVPTRQMLAFAAAAMFAIAGTSMAAAQGPGGPFNPILGPIPLPNVAGAPMFGDGAWGGIKIAENESPLPRDRVFFTYNYFNDSSGSSGRATVGFEKTLADDLVSIGVRLPYAHDRFRSDFGDISLILKARMWEDSGSAVSAGLDVSIPTRNGSPVAQPFIGWVAQPGGPFFLQGFSSVILPAQGSATLANSFGVGAFFPCASGFITNFVPTAELHLTTPLYTGSNSTLDGTLGGRFLFANGASLGVAGSLPLAGPKQYDYSGAIDFVLTF